MIEIDLELGLKLGPNWEGFAGAKVQGIIGKGGEDATTNLYQSIAHIPGIHVDAVTSQIACVKVLPSGVVFRTF